MQTLKQRSTESQVYQWIYINERSINRVFVVCCCHVFGWFQGYMQFVDPAWSNNPILSVICFGIPASVLFWYGNKVLFGHFEAAWSLKLIGFCASFLVFPILAHFMLDESPFKTKTLLCILLSCGIIAIQIFWD